MISSGGVPARNSNDESTPSVHLDARYTRLVGELNIEFDIDLYFFPIVRIEIVKSISLLAV